MDTTCTCESCKQDIQALRDEVSKVRSEIKDLVNELRVAEERITFLEDASSVEGTIK